MVEDPECWTSLWDDEDLQRIGALVAKKENDHDDALDGNALAAVGVGELGGGT